MGRRKTSGGQRSEEWRKFWNSIDGSEIDPSSLKKPKPARITQRQLERYEKELSALAKTWEAWKGFTKTLSKSKRFWTWDAAGEKWLKQAHAVQNVQDGILQALRDGSLVEPGAFSAVKRGKYLEIKRDFGEVNFPDEPPCGSG